jgi:hypothetical protein
LVSWFVRKTLHDQFIYFFEIKVIKHQSLPEHLFSPLNVAAYEQPQAVDSAQARNELYGEKVS